MNFLIRKGHSGPESQAPCLVTLLLGSSDEFILVMQCYHARHFTYQSKIVSSNQGFIRLKEFYWRRLSENLFEFSYLRKETVVPLVFSELTIVIMFNTGTWTKRLRQISRMWKTIIHFRYESFVLSVGSTDSVRENLVISNGRSLGNHFLR